MSYHAQTGRSAPLGATVYPAGTNFSIFSKHASAVELLLFDANDHSTPLQVFRLDPEANKTFYYWHIFVEEVQEGRSTTACKTFRMHGWSGQSFLSTPTQTQSFQELTQRWQQQKSEQCGQTRCEGSQRSRL